MNKILSKIVSWILIFLYGIMLAMRYFFFCEDMAIQGIEVSILFSYGILIVGFYLTLYLHTLFRMIGAAIGGCLTGYRIGYLKIYNFEFLRVNGRTTFHFHPGKRQNLGWTFFPPECKDDRYPFLLHLLGGPIFCLIFNMVLMALSSSLYSYPIVSMILYGMSSTGLLLTLTDGIPMTHKDGSLNVGFTALELAQNDASLQATQLYQNVLTAHAHGISLKDMPAEWFPSPPREEMEDRHVSRLACFTVDRLFFKEQYDDAAHLARELVHFGNLTPNLLDFLTERRLYLELVTSNRPEILSEMLTQKLRNSMEQKAFRDVNTLTARYAYAVLYKHDKSMAQTVLDAFEKEVKGSLFPSGVQEDRSMLQMVDRVAAQRVSTHAAPPADPHLED